MFAQSANVTCLCSIVPNYQSELMVSS